MFDNIDWSTLIGRTIASVSCLAPDGEGRSSKPTLVVGTEDAVFKFTDGSRLELSHERDCCESVQLADIVGDVADIIGEPLLMAEESTSPEPPSDAPEREYEPDSETWTFYKFATVKGYVTLRWCGESNGYYSERVATHFVPPPASV